MGGEAPTSLLPLDVVDGLLHAGQTEQLQGSLAGVGGVGGAAVRGLKEGAGARCSEAGPATGST